jgi:hypothetical protein
VIALKHNLIATANALAATVGFVYIACALFIWFLPELSRSVTASWFHGIDLNQLWTGTASGNFVTGFISAVVGAWIVGYIFAWTYNRFVK